MKEVTLWSDESKKIKPRNRQAAMLIRPSLEIFHPPEPKSFTPKRPDPLHEAKAKKAEAYKKWEQVQAEKESARLKGLELQKARKERAAAKKASKGIQNRWAISYHRKLAKSLGKPKPTLEELEAIRLAMPSTTKPQ